VPLLEININFVNLASYINLISYNVSFS
jgi:hypothetical protein